MSGLFYLFFNLIFLKLIHCVLCMSNVLLLLLLSLNGILLYDYPTHCFSIFLQRDLWALLFYLTAMCKCLSRCPFLLTCGISSFNLFLIKLMWYLVVCLLAIWTCSFVNYLSIFYPFLITLLFFYWIVGVYIVLC